MGDFLIWPMVVTGVIAVFYAGMRWERFRQTAIINAVCKRQLEATPEFTNEVLRTLSENANFLKSVKATTTKKPPNERNVL